ncbi:hypothetical protein MY11210_005100 [Beauveria gryllotalpidicola]
MSKEHPHELQEQQQQQQQQQQPQLSSDEPQQSQRQQPNQHQAIPCEPQPTHNHGPSQDTAVEHHLPSYEQAKTAPIGQPPAGVAPGQAFGTVTPLNQLSNTPQWIVCPFCHRRTKTTVRQEGDSMQIIVGAVLCLVCVCLACLPCLLHWFEDTAWHCSECKNKVAMRKNEGAIEVFGPTRVVYSQYGYQQPMNNSLQQRQQQQQQHQPLGQNTQQSVLQNADVSQQQSHEIQPQPLQPPAQPPTNVKN